MTLRAVRSHPNDIDREQVEALTGMGASPEYIATHLSIPTADLLTHYPDELKKGQEEANVRVARVFFEMATSGRFPQMTVQWMKMRANWSEVTPTQTLTPEELEEEAHNAKEKLLKLLNRGK